MHFILSLNLKIYLDESIIILCSTGKLGHISPFDWIQPSGQKLIAEKQKIKEEKNNKHYCKTTSSLALFRI